MKKILISVLAIVMIISMAIPAVALVKSGEKWETQVPVLAKDSSAEVVIHSAEEIEKLAEEVQKLMAEARDGLLEVCPKGFAIEYFCYMETDKTVSETFAPIDHYEIVFMQYVDGEWVELEHTINQDVSITVDGIVGAPFAVFVKKQVVAAGSEEGLASPKANSKKLLPGQIGESSVMLHSTENVLKKAEEAQKLMAEAKAKLKDACPAGFAVKYFCYAENTGSESDATVTLQPIEHDEFQVKQYVDGAWVELKATVNEDGTVTVEGVAEGPIAVFRLFS